VFVGKDVLYACVIFICVVDRNRDLNVAAILLPNSQLDFTVLAAVLRIMCKQNCVIFVVGM